MRPILTISLKNKITDLTSPMLYWIIKEIFYVTGMGEFYQLTGSIWEYKILPFGFDTHQLTNGSVMNILICQSFWENTLEQNLAFHLHIRIFDVPHSSEDRKCELQSQRLAFPISVGNSLLQIFVEQSQEDNQTSVIIAEKENAYLATQYIFSFNRG